MYIAQTVVYRTKSCKLLNAYNLPRFEHTVKDRAELNLQERWRIS